MTGKNQYFPEWTTAYSHPALITVIEKLYSPWYCQHFCETQLQEALYHTMLSSRRHQSHRNHCELCPWSYVNGGPGPYSKPGNFLRAYAILTYLLFKNSEMLVNGFENEFWNPF